MRKEKKSLEDLINEFIEYWDHNKMCAFFRDILPLWELYDVEEEDDWVEKQVGGDVENVRTIRLTRTVYLLSKIAEFHAGRLCSINFHFKDLWKKMEKEGMHEGETHND